jgi:hypothetical protein
MQAGISVVVSANCTVVALDDHMHRCTVGASEVQPGMQSKRNQVAGRIGSFGSITKA